jgi:hypothetical protein
MIIVCLSVLLVLLDCSLEWIFDYFNRHRGWESISRRARQADSKLHLLRMALGSPAEDGGEWECGSWNVPVLSGEGRFDGPTISEGLVYHVGSPELAGKRAHGDRVIDMPSKLGLCNGTSYPS